MTETTFADPTLKMSREDAIDAMQNGLKVSHDHFTDDEWIAMEGNMVITEEGYRMPQDEFWKYRQTGFEHGWFIIAED